MEEQGTLQFEQPKEPTKFELYDAAHPAIWKAFEEMAFTAMDKGFEHYGAKSIMELIRWHTGINAEFPKGFKVNHNHAPDYARKFMILHPQHEGYFRIKKLRINLDSRVNYEPNK